MHVQTKYVADADANALNVLAPQRSALAGMLLHEREAVASMVEMLSENIELRLRNNERVRRAA